MQDGGFHAHTLMVVAMIMSMMVMSMMAMSLMIMSLMVMSLMFMSLMVVIMTMVMLVVLMAILAVMVVIRFLFLSINRLPLHLPHITLISDNQIRVITIRPHWLLLNDLVVLHFHFVSMPMDLILFVAMLNILIADQALDILTHDLPAHLSFLLDGKLLATALGHQPVGVCPACVQDEVHGDVDGKPCTGDDQHNHRLLYEIVVNDPASGLVDEEEGQSPDDEQVAQGAQELHAMEAECHGIGGFLAGVPDEDEGHEEPDEVGNEVEGVAEN